MTWTIMATYDGSKFILDEPLPLVCERGDGTDARACVAAPLRVVRAGGEEAARPATLTLLDRGVELVDRDPEPVAAILVRPDTAPTQLRPIDEPAEGEALIDVVDECGIRA